MGHAQAVVAASASAVWLLRWWLGGLNNLNAGSSRPWLLASLRLRSRLHPLSHVHQGCW